MLVMAPQTPATRCMIAMLLPLVTAACPDTRETSDGGSAGLGPFGTDGGEGVDGDSASAGSGDGVSAGATDGGPSGPKLDVGAADGSGGGAEAGSCVGPDCGCTGVDLLFVIDNSVSMGDYQVALGQAFPTFAEAIIDVLPVGTSLHVGVTSTTMGLSSGGATSNCVATGDNGQPQEAFYETPDQGDNGTNGAQGRLYVADGMPYFSINTDAPAAEVQALAEWFAAASYIGESGSQIEMSAAAAGWAADPANAATNEGFIRDEGAVLVIFFIQDEPDQSPPDAADDLIQRIAAAKAGCGGMQCVVGGGFVEENCLPEVALGPLMNAFGKPPIVDSLPWDDESITPAYFEPLLRDTLAQVIAQTCDEIKPEG